MGLVVGGHTVDKMDETTVPVPQLWNQVWWKKCAVHALAGVSILLTYKLLKLVFKFAKKMCGACTPSNSLNNNAQYSPDFLVTESKEATKQKLNEADLSPDQFYDFPDLGIDDNAFSKTRQRIPRMPSTVAQATLYSMVRQRQRNGPAPNVMSPPAFPKFDEPMDKQLRNRSYGSKDDFEHFSAGDTKGQSARSVSKQTSSQYDRLDPVPEEYVSDHIDNCEKCQCHINMENESIKNTFHPSCSHKENREINNVCNGKDFSGSDCFSALGKNISSCPSLVVDKQLTQSQGPKTVVESRTPCQCANCVLLPHFPNWDEKTPEISTDDDLTNPQEYFPITHDEFIDDNFEDMESIPTYDFTDMPISTDVNY